MKDWSVKLIDALWAYRTTFRTILSISPYRVVFLKLCHLLVELEHRALWAIKQLNFDLNKAGDLRKLQIFELEEIRNEVYDNARIFKSRTKLVHDQSIHIKNFDPGQKVLLYNSILHLFTEKLKTRWSEPLVKTIFPHGAVKISDPKNGDVFKVNGQQLKPFFTIKIEPYGATVLGLYDPVYK